MKINLRTIWAGPAGCLEPGIHTIADELAEPLIAGGFAVEIAPAIRLPDADVSSSGDGDALVAPKPEVTSFGRRGRGR